MHVHGIIFTSQPDVIEDVLPRSQAIRTIELIPSCQKKWIESLTHRSRQIGKPKSPFLSRTPNISNTREKGTPYKRFDLF